MIAAIFSILLILALLYVAWLRIRMKTSRAYFALTVISSIILCFLTFMSVFIVSLPSALINSGLEKLGVDFTIPEYSWFEISIGLIATIFSILCIIRFANNAIRSWDGPRTVSENDLAKDKLENNLLALAYKKSSIIFANKKDPFVGDDISSWQTKEIQTPSPTPLHSLVRELYQTAYREVIIPDNGWRDSFKGWVGEVYQGTVTDKAPFILLVFEQKPTVAGIRNRLNSIPNAHGAPEVEYVAVYSGGRSEKQKTAKIDGIQIKIMSSLNLIHSSLNLVSYARQLISQYSDTTVGGLSNSLKSTFVHLNVKNELNCHPGVQLTGIINNWAIEDSRRHLSILGEYGQGKSTAMLEYCADWAENFLRQDNKHESKIPLLIELRGKAPGEMDPVSFLSSWASRYGLEAKQVYNLIKSGEAIVIFEGFDELRNAGREYDRYSHFGALWKFAFPNTKIIFTGRPNFFQSKVEEARSLRLDTTRGAAGNVYSEVWEIVPLNLHEISEVCRSFDKQVREGIIRSATNDPAFFEIVARPSMIPVVATIWNDIETLQGDGHTLTSAILIEFYIGAVFRRKMEEIERDRINLGAPPDASYLTLPKAVRELFTMIIAWKMAELGNKNTITRSDFNDAIAETYEAIVILCKTKGVSPEVSSAIIDFESKLSDASYADKVEIVGNEIASASLLVNDPAAGNSNLRFPHKQFFEYMLARAYWTVKARPKSYVGQLLLLKFNKAKCSYSFCREKNALNYFNEIIKSDASILMSLNSRMTASNFAFASSLPMRPLLIVANKLSSSKTTTSDTEENENNIAMMSDPAQKINAIGLTAIIVIGLISGVFVLALKLNPAFFLLLLLPLILAALFLMSRLLDDRANDSRVLIRSVFIRVSEELGQEINFDENMSSALKLCASEFKHLVKGSNFSLPRQGRYSGIDNLIEKYIEPIS